MLCVVVFTKLMLSCLNPVSSQENMLRRMLPREAENGVGMNRSARGGKCKAL